jgi:hypothetical protein
MFVEHKPCGVIYITRLSLSHYTVEISRYAICFNGKETQSDDDVYTDCIVCVLAMRYSPQAAVRSYVATPSTGEQSVSSAYIEESQLHDWLE